MYHKNRKAFLPFVYENHQSLQNYIPNKYSLGTSNLIDVNKAFKETYRPESHYAMMYNYGKELKDPVVQFHADHRYTLDQVNSMDRSNYLKR
jgi:hypothetical protein